MTFSYCNFHNTHSLLTQRRLTKHVLAIFTFLQIRFALKRNERISYSFVQIIEFSKTIPISSTKNPPYTYICKSSITTGSYIICRLILALLIKNCSNTIHIFIVFCCCNKARTNCTVFLLFFCLKRMEIDKKK